MRAAVGNAGNFLLATPVCWPYKSHRIEAILGRVHTNEVGEDIRTDD